MRKTEIAVLCALLSWPAFAQPPKASAPLAKDQGETRTAGKLDVQAPGIRPGAPIPREYTAEGRDVSPELYWSETAHAASYAVIVEDPNAHTARPFVHWLAWNIPASTTQLPKGGVPRGTRQGTNGNGSPGYFGPKPPAGDPDHHYHFEVFALDTRLDVPPGADRDQVVEAMKGHVLAKGELVATYREAG